MVTPDECDRKWRNLLTIYKRRKDLSKKSGEGALPPWKYETVMNDFLGDKPNIDPPESHLTATLPYFQIPSHPVLHSKLLKI
ncbi:hypothetical protein C0J52_02429 [Blattella germanica]|nr:hypothetical protein C0J52_02429 [Blattella germanica]